MALAEASPWPLAKGLALAAVIAFLISPFVSWSRKIPGPLAAKYTRLWYAWQKYRNDFHWTNIQLHRQHGKIAFRSFQRCL